MSEELYRVYSTRDDMRVVWVAMDRRKPPVLYGRAIEGLSAHGEAGVRAREAVNELFTREEAEKWKEHLQEHYDDEDIEVKRVPTPLEKGAESLVYRRGSKAPKPPGKNIKLPFDDDDFEVYFLPANE